MCTHTPNLLGPRDAVAEADDEEERAGEGLLEELAHLIYWGCWVVGGGGLE